MNKYPLVVQQHGECDCGVAALSTVFHYFGIICEYSELYKQMLNDGGDTLGTLTRTAEKYGISSSAFYSGKRSVDKLSKMSILRMENTNHFHYVIFFEAKDGKIVLGDPALGEHRIIEYDDFIAHWTGYFITFLKKKTITKSMKYNTQKNPVDVYFSGLFKKNRKTIVFTLIITGLITILTGFSSYYVKILVDYYIPSKKETIILLLFAGFVFVEAFSSLFSFLHSRIYIRMTSNNTNEAFCFFSEAILQSNHEEYIKSGNSGDTLRRLFDVEKVVTALFDKTIQCNYDIIVMALGIVLIAIYDLRLMCIVLITGVVLYLIIKSMNKKLNIIAKVQMEKRGMLEDVVLQTIRAISSIKSYCVERDAGEKNRKYSDDYFKSYKKYLDKINEFNTTVRFLKGFVELLVMSFGAVLVMQGTLSLGEFSVCNALIAFFWGPLIDLINLQPSFAVGKQGVERIKDIIDDEVLLNSKKNDALIEQGTKDNLGNVYLRNVSLGYGKNIILVSESDMDIVKNSITALIGESGTGKSTLAKLLSGKDIEYKGNLFLDEKLTECINIESLRGIVLYVEQDNVLINASIYDNIRFYDERITNKIIDEFLDAFDFADVKELFVEKFDYMITENGNNISGGQKQIICLLRALVRKPKILILDEITSNLGSILELKVLDLLLTIKQYTTILIISHQLDVIDIADAVYEIKSKKIIRKK